AAAPDLRFRVPFALALAQQLELEASPNGVQISTLSIEEALRAPLGSVLLLPVFTPRPLSDTKSSAAPVLSGFARVEILRPATLEFEPTTAARKSEVQEWMALEVARRQQQLEKEAAAALDTEAREQEERDRRAAEENAKLEREAQVRLEQEERERLAMTPHERIAEKRGKGLEFRYAVEFARAGPIGINWDLHTFNRTVVGYLEPGLRAFALGVIAPKDQLIQLNEVDTSSMDPHEVVAAYAKTTPPRTLVFLCTATTPRAVSEAGGTESQAVQFVQNWTLAFLQPQVLRGWQVRLHIVNWSAMPELDASGQSSEMALVQTTPFLACQPLSVGATRGAPTAHVMYVSYRGGCTFMDKAEHVRQAGGRAALVLNNIKGPGRFPPGMPTTGSVSLPVTMISKLDGEIVLSVLVEDPGQLPEPDTDPNVKKAARRATFWFVNASTPRARQSDQQPPPSAGVATLALQVLPALFGGAIPTMPFRVVAAYPQDTACHHMGLAILATRAVVLVKRGRFSFGPSAG
ncbi:hypothetical protein PybrP1_006343, partial [[Pythium] brassicae (nom. inval.)]